jgi:cold shock CspA family protein
MTRCFALRARNKGSTPEASTWPALAAFPSQPNHSHAYTANGANATRAANDKRYSPDSGYDNDGHRVSEYREQEHISAVVRANAGIVVPNERGFGFIKSEGTLGDSNALFHSSDLDDALDFADLHVGQIVRFEWDLTPRGPRASFVWPDR